ncbi:MAG: hypothetical protein ABI595_06365 [Actinomycetota bacterium]
MDEYGLAALEWARMLADRIDEVQHADGEVLAEGPALDRLLGALTRAGRVWPLTSHSSTIFEWGDGSRSPRQLAEAADILAEVGIETSINGQWLNINLTEPEDGLFVAAPDEEEEDAEESVD